MSLHIRRIERAKDFVALAPLWAKLATESGQTSPFLSHDWFWCCWHGVWPRHRPEILLLEDAGSPVAIIPLMHWQERFHGLPVRYLGFLECPSTPMVDILGAGEHDRVIEMFLDHLVSRSDWDVAWLQKLPVTSPTLKMLEGILPGRLPWLRAGQLFSPCLAITEQWPSFYGAKSEDLKKTHQRIRDQLECSGDVSIEEHRTVDLGSPFFHKAIKLTRSSWGTERGVAMATMPRMLEFFRALTRRAVKNGWFSLWLLRLNGDVIATEYQLRSDGKAQALRSDEDPAYRKLSPGLTLNLAILQSLFECGYVHEYSTGPGFNDDRLWWAAGSHETIHLKLYRPAIYSRLLHRVETVVIPTAEKWRDRASALLPLPSNLGGAE